MSTKESPKRKTFQGVVVSDKMAKTVVVLVSRYVKDAKYKKYLRRAKRYKAHDPEKRFKEGDAVTIAETRPLSKDKHFEVVYAGAKTLA